MAEKTITVCGEGVRLIQATCASTVEHPDVSPDGVLTLDAESGVPMEFLDYMSDDDATVTHHPKDAWFYAMRGNINDWSDLTGPFETMADAAREAMSIYYSTEGAPYTEDEVEALYQLYDAIVSCEGFTEAELFAWLEFEVRSSSGNYVDEIDENNIVYIHNTERKSHWRIIFDEETRLWGAYVEQFVGKTPAHISMERKVEVVKSTEHETLGAAMAAALEAKLPLEEDLIKRRELLRSRLRTDTIGIN